MFKLKYLVIYRVVSDDGIWPSDIPNHMPDASQYLSEQGVVV